MSNSFFQFKQFRIGQERCAMKVGTDGTLLGSWAALPALPAENRRPRVLDIGTGTGLIALMMAQRCNRALVMAIDIDGDAVAQACSNVASSPFAERVEVKKIDIRCWKTELPAMERFDAIVSNPPYFQDALKCPDPQRSVARHNTELTFGELMEAAAGLLADDGEFSLIIPSECKSLVEGNAALAGLFKSRDCVVRTTPAKNPRRCLMAFRKHPCTVETTEGVLELKPGVRSPWYEELTKDFYL